MWGSRLAARLAGFALKIRFFHGAGFLILVLYLPLVMLFVVGIGLLGLKVVTRDA